MTVKQLMRKLQHPPCGRIAAVRIEFADGGIYEVCPDSRQSPRQRRNEKGEKMRFTKIVLLILAACAFSLQAQAQKVPVAVTQDYYAQPKTLILHVQNNSGKDIIAYNITTQLVGGGSSQASSDMLALLVNNEISGDRAAAERYAQETGTGIFTAGATRDITLNGITSGNVRALADVVFYADGTFDEQNKEAFKRIVVERQRQLLAMKKANEIMRNALADAANEHPTATVITELAKAAIDATAHQPDGPYDPVQGQEMSLQREITNMRNLQEGRAQQGTERERLTQYVEQQEKRVELMTPHCQLGIALEK